MHIFGSSISMCTVNVSDIEFTNYNFNSSLNNDETHKAIYTYRIKIDVIHFSVAFANPTNNSIYYIDFYLIFYPTKQLYLTLNN
jgi:hypothetical protein